MDVKPWMQSQNSKAHKYQKMLSQLLAAGRSAVRLAIRTLWKQKLFYAIVYEGEAKGTEKNEGNNHMLWGL